MNNWNNWNYKPQFGFNQNTQGGAFDNIGRKLKTLAKVFFIIQTIFYVVIALVLGSTAGPTGILIALLIAGFLVFSSWIICAVLYGYGEIVEGIAVIANNTKPVMSVPKKEKQKPKMATAANDTQTTQSKVTGKERKQSEEGVKEEPEEDDNYISFNCPYCGEELAVSTDELGKSLFCPHCGQKIK